MKKDENIIYCVFCGAKNSNTDKKCKKCKKKLNPKNHLLKDFLKDHIKDDVKENFEDDILGLIAEWIKAHLFGIFATALIGIVAVGVVVNEANISNTKKNFAKAKIVKASPTVTNLCETKELVDKIKVCDQGYSLSSGNCVKTSKISANATKKCQSGYTLSSNKCISNNTVAKSVKYTCNKSNTTRYTSSGIALRYIILSGTNCNATYCYPQPGTTPENVKTDADCARFFVDTFAADANYYCASYTDSKGNCRNVTNYTTNYSCSKGTLSGKECIIKDTKSPREECPSGYTYNDVCGKCEKVI